MMYASLPYTPLEQAAPRLSSPAEVTADVSCGNATSVNTSKVVPGAMRQ